MKKQRKSAKQIFDRWAPRYDESTKVADWMYRDYEMILDKVVSYALPLSKGALICEIGPGTGNLASRFLKRGYVVIGVEPSQEMRKICQKKHPHIKLLDGHFLSLPLPEGGVGVIVSSYAFHHLAPKEKNQAIREMKRVLKPKGKIIIADLMFKNATEEQAIKKKLEEKGKKRMVEEIAEEYYGLFDKLKRLFTQKGFKFKGEQLTDFVWIFRASL